MINIGKVSKIKKAVFPVAGLGSNFLPATKASPKEMMPIVDMPLIQYVVNEAVAAGMTELIFVTKNSKHAIEDYFATNFELESILIEREQPDLLEVVRNILPPGISCAYVHQKSPLGLGHAVLCAKPLVGNEPFALLLADDLLDCGNKSCLQQMIEIFQEKQSSIIAVQKIPLAESRKYGVVDVAEKASMAAEIQGIIEKPAPADAPSDLGVVGRYILSPNIFTFLERTGKGVDGNIQLTDAIAQLLQDESVFSLQFQGKRYDCGNKLGYLEATVAYALKHPELKQDFRKILHHVKNQ